jgi:hypothetical protein
MKRGVFLLLGILGCANASAAELLERPQPSRFSVEKVRRDPFSALGKLEGGTEGAEVFSPEAATEGQLATMFRVTAYSIDRMSIALINGRAFAEGESFTVHTKEKKHRVTLIKVKQNGVVLKCSGTILNVPMAR